MRNKDRKAKIVCTMGPACWDYENLLAVAKAGMDVARLNFSHGNYETHTSTIEKIRKVESELQRPIATLLDTKGPEIRTGFLENHEKVWLASGASFMLRLEDQAAGNAAGVYVDHAALSREVKAGQNIFIDDGSIHLRVEEIKPAEILCKVIVGGELGERKGINVPEAVLSVPTLTEKDIQDIRWGVENSVDYVAVSFVRAKEDIIGVRRVLEQEGGKAYVIAKIETRQSVECFDEILDVVDGVMVARGDLGVEMRTEDVPIIQKEIILKCRARGKFVIVATQMLDSMIRNPRPTRAEASDVANAVLDGTDAVMLSGETASGKYPVQSVEMMGRIVTRTETKMAEFEKGQPKFVFCEEVADAVSQAAGDIAHNVGASAVLTLTRSGATARMVSKYRPDCRIIALTPSVGTWRALAMSWGVVPMITTLFEDLEMSVKDALLVVQQNGYIQPGDKVVFTSGVPLGVPGTTNTVHVHTVGKVLGSGSALVRSRAAGRVLKVDDPEKVTKRVTKETIIVLKKSARNCMPIIEKAAAVISEEEGLTNHASIAALEYGIPAIVGVKGIYDLLEDGMLVTVDGMHGLIYQGRSV